jgi:hypothetical protein
MLQQIEKDLKNALLAGDKTKVETLKKPNSKTSMTSRSRLSWPGSPKNGPRRPVFMTRPVRPSGQPEKRPRKP